MNIERIPYLDEVSNRWTLLFISTVKLSFPSRREFDDFELTSVELAGRSFQPSELSATFIESCESRIEDHLFDLRINGSEYAETGT